MAKLDELRILRRQRSTDAPINIHGRTGDSSDVGSMLDLYAHSESPEEIILARDDVKARERFRRGFDVYLNRIFDEREREFLRELLHGERTAAKVGAAFGVNYFEFLQSIQQKAYKNAKPLIKLARLSGWEGAAGFISDILQRLQQLQNGAQFNEVIPGIKREEERRAKIRIYSANYRQLHLDKVRFNARKYRRKRHILEWDKRHRARLQDFENKAELAFEGLSKALTAWLEAGKPLEDELYTTLNEKNDIFAALCRALYFERERTLRFYVSKYNPRSLWLNEEETQMLILNCKTKKKDLSFEEGLNL